MPRVLLVAATTGYQTRAFAEAARRLEFDLVLATDRCHVLEDPWGDRAIPVRFDEPGGWREAIEERGPYDAVVAVGDRPALLAAFAAEALGLAGNSPAAVERCSDKFLTREQFRAAGLPVPEFFRVPLSADPSRIAERVPFPCVLKPLRLSASRGVIRANNRAEFAGAFERIRALLDSTGAPALRQEPDRHIQVESYIEGREFALEGLVTGGRLQTLALFDKPDPLDGPFFEETIYVTPSRESSGNQQALIDAAGRAVRALGLTHGPVHAELRLNDEGPWVLEVAARPIGGLCARALCFEGGASLEELILRHAVGQDVSAVRPSQPASGVMMIPIPSSGVYRGVTGVDEASAVPHVEQVIITAKEGHKILALPEGASYLGFIFARSENPDAVERALRQAHRCLHFEISTALPVVRANPNPAP